MSRVYSSTKDFTADDLLMPDNIKAWTPRTFVYVGPEIFYHNLQMYTTPLHGQVVRAIPSDRVDAEGTHSIICFDVEEPVECDNKHLIAIDNETDWMHPFTVTDQLVALFLNGTIDRLIFKSINDKFVFDIKLSPVEHNPFYWIVESILISQPYERGGESRLIGIADITRWLLENYNGPVNQLVW